MKRYKLFWIGLSALILLSACAPAAAPVQTETLASTATSQSTETAAEVPPTPTDEPTLAASSTPTEDVVVDFCVACHTDKETLILVAEPDVEQESESEGVG